MINRGLLELVERLLHHRWWLLSIHERIVHVGVTIVCARIVGRIDLRCAVWQGIVVLRLLLMMVLLLDYLRQRILVKADHLRVSIWKRVKWVVVWRCCRQRRRVVCEGGSCRILK